MAVSVCKILLFPDSNDTDDQVFLDNPERRPVFPDPDPVPGLAFRASLHFPDIVAVKGVGSIIFKGDLNPDTCCLREG